MNIWELIIPGTEGFVPELIQLDLSDTPRTLILSTWFLSFMQTTKTRGLPNDFFKAPIALLLFDEILCDEDAFQAESEAASRGKWITSELFVRLKKAKILTTTSFEKQMPPGFWDTPEIKEQKKKALAVMGSILGELDQGIQPNSKLVAKLAVINEAWFETGLKVNGVKYNWQEMLLKVPSRRRDAAPSTGSVSALLKYDVPDIELLPPLTQGARAALVEAQERERKMYLKAICGKVDKDGFHDFRFKPAFQNLDKIADDDARRRAAFYNLDTILKARDATKDVRSCMQKEIGKVLAGQKTAQQVKAEIWRQSLELASHISVSGGTNWVYGKNLGESALRHLENTRGIVGTVADIGGGAFPIVEVVRKYRERRKLNELRRNNPLGCFFATASKVVQKRNQKWWRSQSR